jgi:hypothetical protein
MLHHGNAAYGGFVFTNFMRQAGVALPGAAHVLFVVQYNQSKFKGAAHRPIPVR